MLLAILTYEPKVEKRAWARNSLTRPNPTEPKPDPNLSHNFHPENPTSDRQHSCVFWISMNVFLVFQWMCLLLTTVRANTFIEKAKTNSLYWSDENTFIYFYPNTFICSQTHSLTIVPSYGHCSYYTKYLLFQQVVRTNECVFLVFDFFLLDVLSRRLQCAVYVASVRGSTLYTLQV